MKKLLVACAVSAAAIAPAAASAADPAPADFKNAAKYCKALKAASGSSSFATMFGTKKNAHGKCVSSTAKEMAATKAAEKKAAKQEREDRVNAAKTCKDAKQADAEKFATDFGTKKNAFGKCVSTTAKQLAAERKAEQETTTA